MASPKPSSTDRFVAGIEAVFIAIENLTFREMGQLAELLHLQAEGVAQNSAADFAQLLADASESFFAADEE